MTKVEFLKLCRRSKLTEIISVLRAAMIDLIDQDDLLKTLEAFEEDRPDDPIYLLHSPYGDLEAHFYIPNSDAADLLEEGCEIIKVML